IPAHDEPAFTVMVMSRYTPAGILISGNRMPGCIGMVAVNEASGTVLVLVLSVKISLLAGFASAWKRMAPIIVGVGNVNVIHAVVVPELHSSTTSPSMAFADGSVSSELLAVATVPGGTPMPAGGTPSQVSPGIVLAPPPSPPAPTAG